LKWGGRNMFLRIEEKESHRSALNSGKRGWSAKRKAPFHSRDGGGEPESRGLGAPGNPAEGVRRGEVFGAQSKFGGKGGDASQSKRCATWASPISRPAKGEKKKMARTKGPRRHSKKYRACCCANQTIQTKEKVKIRLSRF